jgi:hypothetical protein
MWTITSEDLDHAKERAVQRRAEIEAKYAEALKAVEAELTEIEAMERYAGDFAARHPREGTVVASEALASEVVASESEPESPFEAGPGGANEGGHGSRWRLHFGGVRGDREEPVSSPLVR